MFAGAASAFACVPAVPTDCGFPFFVFLLSAKYGSANLLVQEIIFRLLYALPVSRSRRYTIYTYDMSHECQN